MENTIFEQGYNACKRYQWQQHDGTNPYPLRSEEFKQWEKGWSWYLECKIRWQEDEAIDLRDMADRNDYSND